MPAEPVFVDRSGRRRRLFTGLGAGAGVVLVLSGVLLAAGLTGSSPVPLPGLPQGGQGPMRGGQGGAGVQSTLPSPRAPAGSRAGQPTGTAPRAGSAGPATSQPVATSSPAPSGKPDKTHPGNGKPSRSK